MYRTHKGRGPEETEDPVEVHWVNQGNGLLGSAPTLEYGGAGVPGLAFGCQSTCFCNVAQLGCWGFEAAI